jgi:fibronectin type 3 domain-containing protein
MLQWNASAGATSYAVSRSTTNGSGYAQIATTAATNYTDSAVTGGTPYYYVVSASNSSGSSANSSQASATPTTVNNPPPVPTGLAATPGAGQVMLQWNSSAGATSYRLSRSATSGAGYVLIATPTVTNFTDSSVTGGTTYFYVVAAVNANGTSANSSQVSATPASSTAVNVTVDVLADRHVISPYVYGVNFPPSAGYITNTRATLVRWGGNGSSTYNWKLGTDNADNDYFFEDFAFGALGNSADSDSAQFITDVKAAGGTPLTTMAMLPWVAQSPEQSLQQGNGSNNYHWVFSVSQDNACSSTAKTDQFNRDAGVNLDSDCSTTMVASQAQLNRAYFPLLDDHTQACSAGTCEYRIDWVTDATKGLSQAFGNTNTCSLFPNFNINSCHLYNMDNEIDIWGGTHVDVHPNPTTYNELRDVYLTEAGKLGTWDPQAVRFGWVSCCWYYYWNSAAGGSDKSGHAGEDFMPWWLNEVAWNDQINGTRTLDVFDLHAYTEASGSGLTLAQQQALTVNITRDWWDPNYTSQAWFGSTSVTGNQPNDNIPFRIPRARAWANTIYPGTPLAFTEWNFVMVSPNGETDFSTALADVDAWGILGRERVSYSTRWTASATNSPAYNSLLLYRNFDGAKSAFNPISVSATSNASNQGLLSVYASTNIPGTSVTLIVVNKDPVNSVNTQISLNNFTPSQVTAYTLSKASPNSIAAGPTQGWSGSMNFPPFSATLLLVIGSTPSMPTFPSPEWDLNPDTVVVPANGTATISPKLVQGSDTFTLGSPTSQSGITVTTISSTVNSGQNGSVQITAGPTPGFYSYSVPATDSSGVSTSQSGWILVTKPAATLAVAGGNNQSATAGTVLPVKLSVQLSNSPTGSATGGSIFFTITSASGGSMTNTLVGTEKSFAGPKVIAVTDNTGTASVTLTLPASSGPVTVQAEGPYGLGHPVATFNETAN